MKRRPLLLLVGLLAAFGLLAAACGDDSGTSDGDTTSTSAGGDGGVPDGPTIAVGAQDFSESRILAQIYAQALAAGGYDTKVVELGTDAYRDVELEAFDQGKINFAPEYAASMLESLNKQAGEATSDPQITTELLRTYLIPEGLRALAPSNAVDTNGFVVTKDFAEANGLKTLSDLAAKGSEFTLGAPANCETNPFCLPGLKRVYGLDLTPGYTALGGGPTIDALDAGTIDVAVIFTTNPIVEEKGWVRLVDDKNMFAADNVVPVIANALSDAYGDDFVSAVNAVSAKLDTAGLLDLVRQVDIAKSDPDDVAKKWLEDHDLM